MGATALQTVYQTFDPDLPVIFHLPTLTTKTDTNTIPTLFVIQGDRHCMPTSDYYFTNIQPDPIIIPPHRGNNSSSTLDSKYITLIMYATKLEMDMCNFLAIWAVLSILLDTMSSSDLQYVQSLQQVVNNYYDTHTQEEMTKLEQYTIKIQEAMYDSMNKHNFDRVSDAVDRDLAKVDTNNL